MSNKIGILEAIDKTPNGKKSMLHVIMAMLFIFATVFGVLLWG